MDEMEGLFKIRGFRILKSTEVPRDANMLGWRFIQAIKNHGTNEERYKD